MSQKKVDNYRAGMHGLPSALRWLAGSDFLPTLKLKQKKHLP